MPERPVGRLKARLLAWPPAARLRRVAYYTHAAYGSMSHELTYFPADKFREEVLDLRALMRRSFQVLSYNGITGDYAEFGCFGGRTFTLAWGARTLIGHDAHMWAFDSFQGLPASTDPRDAHVGWTEGAMSMGEQAFIEQCRANGVPDDAYTTVAGFYSDSLAPSAPGPRPDKIAFAYVDCDLYSSTAEALAFLSDRICSGAVLAFDDYYCFTEAGPSGERLALAEFMANNKQWRLVPYIQWGWYGMSFMVEPRDSITTDSISW